MSWKASRNCALRDDLFAQLWRGANKLQDEYGNPAEIGLNGFRPYFVHWSQHPERDEKWAKEAIHFMNTTGKQFASQLGMNKDED